MIPALLIGRKGSSGFPGKNTHQLLGQPMVHYPLEAARLTPSVGGIWVSTDCPDIKKIAESKGVRIIDRPDYLCTKEALGEDAFKHGFDVIARELAGQGDTIEMIVLLFANAPTISADLIEQGIQALRSDPSFDSAVTVSRYNMWSPLRARQRQPDGSLRPFVPFETFGDPKTLNCDRDSQGDVLFADMGVSVVRPHCLEEMEKGLLPQKWMGQKIYPIENWGGLDVDYEWQMPQAEFWLKAHGLGSGG